MPAEPAADKPLARTASGFFFVRRRGAAGASAADIARLRPMLVRHRAPNPAIVSISPHVLDRPRAFAPQHAFRAAAAHGDADACPRRRVPSPTRALADACPI
jgi:hypothetical protein